MPGELDPYMATLPATQAVAPAAPSAYGSLLGGLEPRKLDAIMQQLRTLPAIDMGWYKPLLVKAGKKRLASGKKSSPKRKKGRKKSSPSKGTRSPKRGGSSHGGGY